MTVVWTNGCFDLLHPGHLYILEESRKLGDTLIVGLNNDKSVTRLKGEGRPVQPYKVRAKNLLKTGLVDRVVAIGDSPLFAIEEIKPDIITKGDDYKESEVIGHDNTKVQIIRRISGYSTTRLIPPRKT
jgi:D-beta-D-heptose 7-phosphate kinase/D-beta-D-heptose 1-phosphate adenosyltransferase